MTEPDWEFLASWIKGVLAGTLICVALAIFAYVAIQVWFK